MSRIVSSVCQAIWDVLSPIHMRPPQDDMNWLLIAENFGHKWQFPHCLGAIYGKHLVMKAPDKSGSLFFNYKQTFSIVLLAVVNSTYRFVAIDVGAYGKSSDGDVLKNSEFGQRLSENNLHIPPAAPSSDAPDLGPVPYVFVADEAFPISTDMMRPFPGRKKRLPLHEAIFNYRLSRARRIVENAFGILASRWRIYERRINLNAPHTRKMVLATCILHNFLQTNSTPVPVPSMEEPPRPEEPEGLVPLRRFGYRGGNDAMGLRNLFANYFKDINTLPWQTAYVERGLHD